MQLAAGLLSSGFPEASANGKSRLRAARVASTPTLASCPDTATLPQTSTVLRHGETVGKQHGFNSGWQLKSVQHTVATVHNCISGTMQDAGCVE